MNEQDKIWGSGFSVGFLMMGGLMLVLAIVGALGGFFDDPRPYAECKEDEVFAWQLDYRPAYGESEWQCVAIDDLTGGTR